MKISSLERQAYEWSINQEFPSVAARYARALAQLVKRELFSNTSQAPEPQGEDKVIIYWEKMITDLLKIKELVLTDPSRAKTLLEDMMIEISILPNELAPPLPPAILPTPMTNEEEKAYSGNIYEGYISKPGERAPNE